MLRKLFKKLTPNFFFSYALFVLAMSLDFAITDVGAEGSPSFEGNYIASLWWSITGNLHHFDIPIWLVYVFMTALIISLWNEFFALWWMNGLAFGHLMGFISWLPSGVFDFLYRNITNDLMLTTALSGIGLLIGLPLALLQTLLAKRFWPRPSHT